MVARIGALGQGELAEDDGAGGTKAGRHCAVLGGAEVAVDRHTTRGRRVMAPAEVLDRDRHAVKRTANPAGRDLALRRRGFRQGSLRHHRLIGPKRAVERGDAIEHRPCERERRQLARVETLADLAEARKGEPVRYGRHNAIQSVPASKAAAAA